MKYGFVITGGNAGQIVDFGIEIERAGWDAAFGWEIVYGLDPWVLLGAIAARTERIKLGTLVTPPSRRRPWKLASELATLDHLSNGRAVIAVGLGATDTGFASVGETIDRKTRAERLDESLELMDSFWKSEPFKFEGKHYQVNWQTNQWSLSPVQQPRIPIWVVALWGSERSVSRAARWDGILPAKRDGETGWSRPSPEDVVQLKRELADRGVHDGYDIVIEGVSPIGDAEALDTVDAYAEAGATWWIESMWEAPGGLDAVRERILAGPPNHP